MRVQDCNWMQLEEYLRDDDRIVLPFGSIEQHGYLSLGVDMILSERVSVEAAEPLGVPVLPSLPYGITPYFAAYPGSPTLSVETYQAVVRELLDSLYEQGFRRFLLVNGHGGNDPGRRRRGRVERRAPGRSDRLAQLVERPAHLGGRPVDRRRREPRLLARELPVDAPRRRRPAAGAQADGRHLDDASRPVRRDVREELGDGSFGGLYERPDDDVLRVWRAGVEEVRDLIENGWANA